MKSTNPPSDARTIAQKSGSNFLSSFRFLPADRREGLQAVYAFARRVDDSVDEVNDPAVQHQRLEHWREQLDLCFSCTDPDDPAIRQLKTTVEHFNIPRQPFDDLLRGCEMDIEKTRYATFSELETYCYHVASAVGLMCLPIFGCNSPPSREYAVLLGKALQLTNILRDVGADAERDRIYLPQEDLDRFHVNPEEIMQKTGSENFEKLMFFEAGRARGFYREAAEKITPRDRSPLLAARIMGRIYFALLEELEKSRFRVFEEKISLSKARRTLLALATWLGMEPPIEVPGP
jgi:15-cis-phytoene synthase